MLHFVQLWNCNRRKNTWLSKSRTKCSVPWPAPTRHCSLTYGPGKWLHSGQITFWWIVVKLDGPNTKSLGQGKQITFKCTVTGRAYLKLIASTCDSAWYAIRRGCSPRGICRRRGGRAKVSSQTKKRDIQTVSYCARVQLLDIVNTAE